jgi:hypothetical protein
MYSCHGHAEHRYTLIVVAFLAWTKLLNLAIGEMINVSGHQVGHARAG